MKMSYFDKVEIPYFKDAIILFLRDNIMAKRDIIMISQKELRSSNQKETLSF